MYIYTYVVYVVRNLALQLSFIFKSKGIMILNGLNLARGRGEYAIVSYFGLFVKL